MIDPGEDRARVAAHWSDGERTRRLAEIHWMASPVVCAHLNQRVSGDPRTDWLTWSWRRHVEPLARRRGADGVSVLVLGCGDGWLERALARRPEVAVIDACDVAAGAVEAARRRAVEEGLAETLRYHVVDLDRDPLPGRRWDVVVAHSVLHHVTALERCYDALAAALPGDGLLLVNEYTGPRRFQFTAEQMAAINGSLRRLPERLRRSAVTGEVYPHKEIPDEAQLIATDPSEAVRSDEVVPLLRERFEVLDEADCGGSVLHLLLYDLVHNFDAAERGDNRLLALLCLLESVLVDAGALDSDYQVLVARPRQGGGGPSSDPGVKGASRSPRSLPPALFDAPAAVSPPSPEVGRLRIHTQPDPIRRVGLEHPAVREALHERVTGDPDCDWVSHVLAAYLPAGEPGPAWVLGQEGSWLVERLAGHPAITEASVVPPEVLEPQSETGWPPGKASWILTDGQLGRADRPRSAADRLAAALRPGGLLVGDEPLAADDEPIGRATLRLAREMLELLQPSGAPPSRGLDRLRDRWADLRHRFRRERGRPPLGQRLGDRFEIVALRPQLGALIDRVLGPVADARGTESLDPAFLRLLCYAEELWTDAGVIAAERCCFVARRRG